MIDVSDGLLADVGHIADASGVAVDISTPLLAADTAALHARPSCWPPAASPDQRPERDG